MASPRQKPFNALHSAQLFIAVFIIILLIYPALSTAGQFKVVRVTDGDTIKLRSAGSKSDITIRLVGIDAPETSKKKNDPGQQFSQKSTKHLAGLVLNKSVDVNRTQFPVLVKRIAITRYMRLPSVRKPSIW